MAMVEDYEPASLLAKLNKERPDSMLLDEKRVVPALMTAKEEKVSDTNMWYLDNGASNHMTGFKTKFEDLDESIIGQVRFGDGSIFKIKGKGTVMMMCKNGEERAMHEVYYIPSLRNNIVSLGKLYENRNRVELRGEFL